MMKTLVLVLLGCLTGLSFAHEIGHSAGNSLASLSQMAKRHAQKVCVQRSDRDRLLCERAQVRSMAETVASVPELRPAGVSPDAFAAMIEVRAAASPSTRWSVNAAADENRVDCRVDVC